MRKENEENIKQFIEKIKTEDELPSQAGVIFRQLISDSSNLGWRERDIIKDWIEEYNLMDEEERQAILDELEIQ